MTAPEILSTASAIVTGDRQAQYGAPEDNFARIAAMWSTYLETDVSPVQVAWMLVLLKVACAGSGAPHLDNAVDAAGYAALAGQMAEGEQ